MRKFLLIIGLLSPLVLPASAQRAETSFYGSHLKKTYYVKATQPNTKGRYDLHIEMQSLDELSKEIYLDIQYRTISKWIETLQEVKDTYVKWRETAITNEVTKASKTIKECGTLSYLCFPVFKYGDWHKVMAHPILFVFQVSSDDINLIIATGRVTASKNQFISSDGGVIILSSEQEIDDFIACFDDEWVRAYYDAKKDTDDLFN